ncbi:MAG: DegT/DnrJ/EryC1/StrS family aminotransferase [Candidatus Krumholzibacteria bacterium]|nr:DegT/DnrJ/EryC1/StrS family aminotransferase [Candidatus Krumholzibacteria bacterium]
MEVKALHPDRLAIDGGVPVRSEPLSRWPQFDAGDIDAVSRVLRSGKVNYWTGDECRQFEKEFAALCGTRHAVALANGTVAIELALETLGVGDGDEVIVTSRSFVASASAIVMCGARAVFADVDRNSQNITAETIAPLITPLTKAILCVHLAGLPCDMDPIMELAGAHDLYVVEDCAQAHGALYKGRPVGGIGHAGAFSFCQDKIMTTGGEGGMFVTNDESVWRRAWAYKDHGKSYKTVYEMDHKPGFVYLHESFGSNWRLTEMQAAIGRRQLLKLAEWHRQRTENARLLQEGLRGLPALRVPDGPGDVEPAWYKFYAFVVPEALKPDWDRYRLKEAISAEGIPCFSGSCPEIYNEKAFAGTDMEPAAPLPVARELGETSIMFLVHPTLGRQEMAQTIEAVGKVLTAATR